MVSPSQLSTLINPVWMSIYYFVLAQHYSHTGFILNPPILLCGQRPISILWTLEVYLAAIHLIHIENGLPDPTTDELSHFWVLIFIYYFYCSWGCELESETRITKKTIMSLTSYDPVTTQNDLTGISELSYYQQPADDTPTYDSLWLNNYVHMQFSYKDQSTLHLLSCSFFW